MVQPPCDGVGLSVRGRVAGDILVVGLPRSERLGYRGGTRKLLHARRQCLDELQIEEERVGLFGVKRHCREWSDRDGTQTR